jgi:hypothetical protein
MGHFDLGHYGSNSRYYSGDAFVKAQDLILAFAELFFPSALSWDDHLSIMFVV